MGLSVVPVAQQRLTASSPAEDDRFGIAVGLTENLAVIGAPAWVDTIGHAYVFTRTGDDWILEATLTGPSGEPDLFGSVVAVAGDSLAVAAPAWVGSGPPTGVGVYVFVRDGNDWALQVTLPDPLTAGPFHANALAFGEDRLLVGAATSGVGGGGAGAVYEFRRVGGMWSPQHSAAIEAPDAQVNDTFGWAVALHADVAVIGAPGVNEDRGAVYVYQREAGEWSLQTKLSAPGAAPGDRFGYVVSVDASHGHLVAGAPLADVDGVNIAGYAAVFSRTNTVWSLDRMLTAADPAQSHMFGNAVAVSDNLLAIGQPRFNAAGDPHGRVSLYVRSDGLWPEVTSFSAPGADDADAFGVDLALQASTLAVGASIDDADRVESAGSAWLYDAHTLRINGFLAHSVPQVLEPVPVEAEDVSLVDAFGQRDMQAVRVQLLGNPARINLGGPCEDLIGRRLVDETAHLVIYALVEQPSQPPFDEQLVTAVDMFGGRVLVVEQPESLLVPAEKELFASELLIDHFLGYRTRSFSPTEEFDTVPLYDQFSSWEVRPREPVLFCLPVSKNGSVLVDPAAHLVGYRIDPSDIPPRNVRTSDQFGGKLFVVRDPRLLLVPAVRQEPPNL